MRIAPADSVVTRMAGSSSGASPTANAMEKRMLSTTGLWKNRLKIRMPADRTKVIRIEQVAEMPDADLEGRRLVHLAHAGGDLAEFRVLAGPNHQGRRFAAHDAGALEECILPVRHGGIGGHDTRFLFGREGFTRQRRLVDVHVLALQQQTITGHDIAGFEQRNVARNDVLQPDVLRGPRRGEPWCGCAPAPAIFARSGWPGILARSPWLP